MTTTIPEIADRHLRRWFEADVNTDHAPTLRFTVESAIQEALDALDAAELASQLAYAEKNSRGWQAAYLAESAQYRAIKAGLSFDPKVDRDPETCARRLYHALQDMTRARDDAVAAAHLLADELAQARSSIEVINATATPTLTAP